MSPETELFLKRDCREFLLEEFEGRKARRPSYSLRAFARDIGVDASRLTAILNGKYGLSKAAAIAIGERLNFNHQKLRFFADLAESQHGRSRAARQEASLRVEKARFDFGCREFQTESDGIIRHWYYLAVHQLVIISGATLNAKKISKRLGIPLAQAEEALQYLYRRGIVKVKGDGYRAVDQHLSFNSPTPSGMIRNFHREVLNKTIDAIELNPIAARKNLSSVISVDSNKIAEAREWINKTHQEFIKQFGTSENADRVYAFGSHFVPLEKGNHDEG